MTSAPVVVRPLASEAVAAEEVAADEVAALAALHARAFAAPWSAEAIGATLRSGAVFALAAGPPDAPLGFVLVQAAAGEAEILTLAVDPAVRRSGIGRTLVEAAVKGAVARGVQSLWLEVAEDNAPARALYAALGFIAVGRRRGYYGRPGGAVDALALSLALNSPAASR